MSRVPSALRCLCGLLAWLAGLCGSALAQGVALDVAAAPARAELLQQLSVLVDRDASLGAGQALARRDWRPATPRNLNLGLTAAALWLRLELRNDGSEEDTRWIALGNPRLEEVRLYRAEGGQLIGVASAGTLHPPAVPLARGIDAVFELKLAPGEQALLLLRARSRSTLATQPELWQPLAYLEQQAAQDLQYLLPVGLMLGLVLYLLASTLWRRNWLLFMLALWMLVGTLYDLTFNGYLRSYLIPQGSPMVARLMPMLALLTVLLLSVYLYVYLEMGRRRGWRQFYRGVALSCALLALATLSGPLLWINRLSSLTLLAFFLIWPFSLVRSWREGASHVRMFVLAMACGWLFSMIRMSNITGYLSVSGLTLLYVHVAVIFKLLITLVLLYATVRQSTAASRAVAAMQAELMSAQQQEQERLEQAVQLRSAALRQAVVDADEAVRAKGELLARVGHDLRAPLSAIMACSTRLEPAGGAVRQAALAMGQLAREQLALINGLIEFARAGVQPDAVLPQPLYLGAWLRSIAEQAGRLAAQHGSHFGWRADGTLPDVVELDAKRARQVLLLLLTHAMERARQGQVALRIEALPAAGTAADQALELVFTVSDDGPGMAAGQLATIFQPFLRLGAGQAYQEVGLGLAIAHQWTGRMGGSLRLLPSDCGLVLQLSLPVAQACEADIAPRHLRRQEAPLPELDGRGRRLWLAEDSHVVRDLLAAELSGLGFELTLLADGQQAIAQLRALRVEPPDLLLTDLSMLGADGITLSRSARARWPGLPVVLLTSAPELLSGLEHDFSALLAKPVSLAELRATLASLLGLELDAALLPEQGP